jgi:hypothetical protein
MTTMNSFLALGHRAIVFIATARRRVHINSRKLWGYSILINSTWNTSMPCLPCVGQTAIRQSAQPR